MDCKYCQDEVCVNADCPMCADYLWHKDRWRKFQIKEIKMPGIFAIFISKK